jgi:hypothetical protein
MLLVSRVAVLAAAGLAAFSAAGFAAFSAAGLAAFSGFAAGFSAGAAGVDSPLLARAIASISATLGLPPAPDAAGLAAAGFAGGAGAAGPVDAVSGGGSPGAFDFAAPDSGDEAAPPPAAFSARAAANISATEGRFFSSAILVSGAHGEPEYEIYVVR